MVILVQIKNELDQVHVFQIYLQAIMYHFEHTNYDIHQDFLF